MFEARTNRWMVHETLNEIELSLSLIYTRQRRSLVGLMKFLVQNSREAEIPVEFTNALFNLTRSLINLNRILVTSNGIFWFVQILREI